METAFFNKIFEENKVLEKCDYPFHIRSVIGSLQWLANQTQPDIAYATNTMASFQEKPTKKMFWAVARIVSYLSATADYGV